MSACPAGVRWPSNLMHPASDRLGLTIVLKAYLDASDPNGNIPVAVVAGFVTDLAGWENFEVQWRPLMKELELARWHMTDFRNRDGQYAKWPDAQFLYAKGRVISILNSCQLFGSGYAINVEAFNEWRVTCGYYVNPDPYFFCLDKMLGKLIRGLVEHPIDEGVAIYCDRDKGRERLGLNIAEWHDDQLRTPPR